MMLRGLVRIALVSLSLFQASVTLSLAQEAHDHDEAASGPFRVMGLITKDLDWQSKWNTPRTESPNFVPANELYPGDRATVLTFYTGASAKAGKVKLTCHVEMTPPVGDVQTFGTPECANSTHSGPLTDVYLTRLGLDFEIEDTDPPGLLSFKITITDVNANQELVLNLSTNVRAQEAAQ